METRIKRPARAGDRKAATVGEAITSRKSVRAFADTEVPRDLIERILAIASRAPSGSNIQPWKVYVLRGTPKAAISAEMLDAHYAGADHREEYDYYPSPWREPYLARRRKVGYDLYRTLGIAHGNKDAKSRQLARNYVFFDAPVGLIFTIDRDLPVGSWLDYGGFLQSIMIAAREFGLATCPQQAFAKYHEILGRHLGIPESEMVVCGMSLGYADVDAPVNQLETERLPVAEFTTFLPA